MRVGDFCVVSSPRKQGAWDSLGEAMIVNHSLNTQLNAICDANAIMELAEADALEQAPVPLVRAYNAVIRMIHSPKSVSERLARITPLLQAV